MSHPKNNYAPPHSFADKLRWELSYMRRWLNRTRRRFIYSYYTPRQFFISTRHWLFGCGCCNGGWPVIHLFGFEVHLLSGFFRRPNIGQLA